MGSRKLPDSSTAADKKSYLERETELEPRDLCSGKQGVQEALGSNPSAPTNYEIRSRVAERIYESETRV
jgi:hypothetical protein